MVVVKDVAFIRMNFEYFFVLYYMDIIWILVCEKEKENDLVIFCFIQKYGLMFCLVWEEELDGKGFYGFFFLVFWGFQWVFLGKWVLSYWVFCMSKM